MQVLNQIGRKPRLLRTTYSRCCDQCERGRPGNHPSPEASCLGCLLLAKDFLRETRHTLDRALENAAVKAGVRRDDLVTVLVTGGTSLMPCVRRLLVECFDNRVVLERPFDAVARGACRGVVVPILQHDYAIGSYNRQTRQYAFTPLFQIGTEYPTPRDAVRLWAKVADRGQPLSCRVITLAWGVMSLAGTREWWLTPSCHPVATQLLPAVATVIVDFQTCRTYRRQPLQLLGELSQLCRNRRQREILR